MATISGITSIKPSATARVERIILGATIAAFNCLYPDPDDDGKYKEAIATSEAASLASCFCITGGDDGDHAYAIFGGEVSLIGASNVTRGRVYVLDHTAGDICNDGDLIAGNWLTQVGHAESTSVLFFDFQPRRIQL